MTSEQDLQQEELKSGLPELRCGFHEVFRDTEMLRDTLDFQTSDGTIT